MYIEQIFVEEMKLLLHHISLNCYLRMCSML